MFVADAIASLIMFGMVIALGGVVLKYRKEILDWLAKPPSPRRAASREMDLFDALIDSGMSESEAIRRVRNSRIHRNRVKEAIAKDVDDTEPTVETGE